MSNEIDLDFGSLDLNDTNNITISKINVKESKPVTLSNIPKSEGSIAEQAKRKSLTITVEGDIAGSEYDDLRSNLDALRAGLQNGFQKFTLDDDRYIMAQLKDFDYSKVVFRGLAQWRATFIAHYPFWLSETLSVSEETPTSGVGYTVNNPGNAPARVKITITAGGTAISDDIKIQNSTTGEVMQYRGTLASTKALVVDNRVDSDDFVVENDGDDDIVNFEGDFITLASGDNTIIFTSAVSATVKIEYRGTYY